MNRAARKLEAIYELRAAAEEKGRAETLLDVEETSQNRDALLDAKTALEAKTVKAIDACEECHHTHAADEPHGPNEPNGSNVVQVDFNDGKRI